MRRWLTASNVLATLALFLSLAGTSYAVVMVTGKHVVNASLTGEDVKDKGLYTAALSEATRNQLKAQKGEKGFQGLQGPQGDIGTKGSKGDKGTAAPRAYSFISADDGNEFMGDVQTNYPGTESCPTGSTNNVNGGGAAYTCSGVYYPVYNYDCNDAGGRRMCAINEVFSGVNDVLGRSAAAVLRFASGVGQSNGGHLSLARPGNIIVTGNVVLYHNRYDGHSRVSCQAATRRSATSDPFEYLGTPTVVSSDLEQRVVHLTVVGGRHYDTPGNYDFQVECRELDDRSPLSDSAFGDDWVFIRGNANAIATEL